MSEQNKPFQWKRIVHLHDGRTFVSDGPFSLDAALAKPVLPPDHVLPEATTKIVEGYLTAPLLNEFALSELHHDAGKYVAPTGVLLNPIYVDYLAGISPAAHVRFRMGSSSEPIVILSDGKAVGLLMPMKQ